MSYTAHSYTILYYNNVIIIVACLEFNFTPSKRIRNVTNSIKLNNNIMRCVCVPVGIKSENRTTSYRKDLSVVSVVRTTPNPPKAFDGSTLFELFDGDIKRA